MAEYIDRERLLHRFNIDDMMNVNGTLISLNDARNVISNFPSEDVVPVVHGRWIRDNDSFQTDDYYCCYFDHKCSECGEIVSDRYGLPNYCPNCGARMDGDNNGET